MRQRGQQNRRPVPPGPDGGLVSSSGRRQPWRWHPGAQVASRWLRCEREHWYLLRARPAGDRPAAAGGVRVLFGAGDETLAERAVRLVAPADPAAGRDLLGWFQAPAEARQLAVALPDGMDGAWAALEVHAVAERDPKCHPLANVPRWSTYRPPFALDRLLLPEELAGVGDLLAAGRTWEVLRPTSFDDLLARSAGAAVVLGASWGAALSLDLARLVRLSERAWVIVDLATFAGAAAAAGVPLRLRTYTAEHEIMSARVAYADVPTRGFALQDVFPLSFIDAQGRFATRAIAANPAWRRYADDSGCAALLTCETPEPRECGGVLLAARPSAGGELLPSDLPWLVAGRHGPLLAPRVALHAAQMLCGGPLDDDVQYWNRWDDDTVLLRDVADLARRFPELTTVRWRGTDHLAHLGLSVALPDVPTDRQLLVRTGRMDQVDLHDGVPPEAMIIAMKALARAVRDRTPWAQRYLAGLRVTWQFDTASGLRYAVAYRSAQGLADLPATRTVRIVAGPPATDAPAVETLYLADDPGLLGDGALALQAELTRWLRGQIERGVAPA